MNNKAIAAIALLMIVCAPIALGYILNVQDVDNSEWKRGDVSQLNSLIETDRVNDYTPYTGIYNNYLGIFDDITVSGKIGLAQLDFVSVTDTVSSVPVRGDGTPEEITSTGANINLGDYGGDYYTLAFDNHRAHDYYLTKVGGAGLAISSPEISGSSPIAVHMIKEGTTVTIDNTVYNDIESVEFHIGSGQTVKITPTNIITGYADVSKGWYVDPNVRLVWSNNHTEYDALFMVDMPVSTGFYMYESNMITGYTHFVRDASGVVTITTFDGSNTEIYTLGNYQYIMIDSFIFDNGVVSGIAAWPQMGVMPAAINTIEIDSIINHHVILTDSADIHFRVDRSGILNSTHLVAHNATIDVQAIKPAMTSYDLDLYYTSIAGTSVTFAGNNYLVSNGKIHVGARSFDITNNHLVISSRTEDNVTWNNYINDIPVGTTNLIQNPTLNGDWSIGTYNLYGLTMIHSVKSEWVSGSFGLDMSEVALIGLGVCAVAFIALGMTGKASGAKAILLAIICGGGALIFAVMI